VLALTLFTGCSGDDGCEGEAYHPDLGTDGSKTPIASLEVWLGTHEGLPDPPVENWIVVDSGEANAIEVVIKNDDGDGWWVTSARTDSGGWIVSSATDNAAACEDELS
jgi:hypothetical protein